MNIVLNDFNSLFIENNQNYIEFCSKFESYKNIIHTDELLINEIMLMQLTMSDLNSKLQNINFIREFFDDNITNLVNEKIDVILHSHLFEHIYEPNIFLKNCFDLLSDDGEMFFSVPNMQFMADNSIVPFFGVFFEHTIFLNKEAIRSIRHPS